MRQSDAMTKNRKFAHLRSAWTRPELHRGEPGEMSGHGKGRSRPVTSMQYDHNERNLNEKGEMIDRGPVVMLQSRVRSVRHAGRRKRRRKRRMPNVMT